VEKPSIWDFTLYLFSDKEKKACPKTGGDTASQKESFGQSLTKKTITSLNILRIAL